MAIISDTTMFAAKGRDVAYAHPIKEGAIQPGSLDLTLGSKLKVLEELDDFESYNIVTGRIDQWPGQDRAAQWEEVELPTYEPNVPGYELEKGRVYLGVTNESIFVRPDQMAFIHGRSTVGRAGVMIHTAGVVDPGWMGSITLEIVRLGEKTSLYAGIGIAQCVWHRLDTMSTNPYSVKRNKYQGGGGSAPVAPEALGIDD